jgi:pyruvate dehydrogenase E1 component
MPDFWQFPTVSMGLGPLQAIYQARFMKYLQHRGSPTAGNRKVWAFMGDGETDEPESLGAIGMAGREKLDNLVFVINCNLQRLDGPVRGNGKIIQELESDFRGAGWNVIKVIWGTLLGSAAGPGQDRPAAKAHDGVRRRRVPDLQGKDGAYVREHFFGKYPELAAWSPTWSDDDIWRLNRGGHDPHKVYAAYAAAVKHTGQPTVILAKTIKGYGMGEAGEAQNITHQQKKMGTTSLKAFRDRFGLPVKDEELESCPT